ncbi:LIPT2 lipoyltransferase, partial [Amia calva]|nr:LIPT2 lipoyltransferase [Amia calva]
MTPARASVQVVNLGRISYANSLQVQQQYVRQQLDSLSRPLGQAPNTLLLCEHPPVYTVGLRQATYPAEEERRLRRLGAEFFRTNRGGLVTFHGPGQLVCYPLCGRFGIKASTSPDTGVWVAENKICAIGIHCGRYITSHGLALNCNTELSWFEHIVPCGIVGKGVTSLSRELKREITVAEATQPLLETFAEQFNCSLTFENVVEHKK